MRRRSKKHWPLVHWGEGLAVGCSPPKMKIDQRNVWQALDDSFSRSRCQSDYLLAPHSSMSFVSAYRHNMNLYRARAESRASGTTLRSSPFRAKASALQSHLMPAKA
jgi:hypothetical protein